MSAREDAALVLADGTVFEGEMIGADPGGLAVTGEVVFNTVMSGYQEVMTDPSYAGQIVTFTTAHIGNYGAARADDEAPRPHARGVVVADYSRIRSNWRSDEDLDAALRRWGLSGIAGIDTRRLTRRIRDDGAMPGAFGTGAEAVLLAAAKAEPGTAGVDLVSTVTTDRPYTVGQGPLKVIALDFGIKRTILTCLADFATVTVVPASTTADEILAARPDGLFLSNGPGDPEMVAGAPSVIREVVEAGVPTFGICLGHQLLSLAFGGRTFKLPFGHHGGNHPVMNLATGSVEVTSQNHNYCVDADSLSSAARITHVNLNDRTNEGMTLTGHRAFSVQYHPEAGPGPHDSRYLFARFRDMMNEGGR